MLVGAAHEQELWETTNDMLERVSLQIYCSPCGENNSRKGKSLLMTIGWVMNRDGDIHIRIQIEIPSHSWM